MSYSEEDPSSSEVCNPASRARPSAKNLISDWGSRCQSPCLLCSSRGESLEGNSFPRPPTN